MDAVKVYNYESFDRRTRLWNVRPVMATAATIVQLGPFARMLRHSVVEVDASDVDAYGYHRPKY